MTKKIPLTQGKFALVDDADFDWINQWKWNYHQGYATRTIYKPFKKTILMHRVIMNTPDGMETDHIKIDETLNNQRSNLRICTTAENRRNYGLRKDNTSGYKGVHKTKNGKWQARIQVGGKRVSLGVFISAEQAVIAYDSELSNYHGEFANFNLRK